MVEAMKKLLVWWRKRRYVVVCFDDRCSHYCVDCNAYCPPRTGLCKGDWKMAGFPGGDEVVDGSNYELIMQIMEGHREMKKGR